MTDASTPMPEPAEPDDNQRPWMKFFRDVAAQAVGGLIVVAVVAVVTILLTT